MNPSVKSVFIILYLDRIRTIKIGNEEFLTIAPRRINLQAIEIQRIDYSTEVQAFLFLVRFFFVDVFLLNVLLDSVLLVKRQLKT